MIYLLTDGDFPDNQKVLDTVRLLQPTGKKTKIQAIVFEDPAKARQGHHRSDERKLLTKAVEYLRWLPRIICKGQRWQSPLAN